MNAKILLTVPFRAIPGTIALLFCGMVLLIGSFIKIVCMPNRPVFDYAYKCYDNDYQDAVLVSWKKGFELVCKWVIYGET